MSAAGRRRARPGAARAPRGRVAGVLAIAVIAAGCAEMGPGLTDGGNELPPVDGDAVPPGWRAPEGPCELDPPSPSRLVLTTTDFSTGAITVVHPLDGAIEVDVAVGSSDAIPFFHDGRLVLVHRFNLDRIDVLDPDSWSLVAQHALSSPDVPSVNPHGIAFDAAGLAYVTSFAEPTLRVLDLAAPPSSAERARVDLGDFADADGNPEASEILRCGDLLWVLGQRLDPSFTPVDTDVLVPIDPAAPAGPVALDLDPATPRLDGLPLLGQWNRQLRRDPTDPEGRTLLGLSTGIERIALATGRRSWAVSPDRMAQADLAGWLQPQAFDVDDAGTRAYLAAYDPDFGQVRLYVVGLDDASPPIPEPFADGMDSVEQSLELVGDQLWYGSNRVEAPGLWRFDVSTDPPQVVAGPLSTGLAPYSLVAIP